MHAGLNRRYAQLPTAQEIGLPHGNGYASACENYDDLVYYFGINNCNAMEAMGYMVAEYEVTDYIVCEGQLVFKRDTAEFIEFDD